jgi:ATP-dependent Lhr-like helicase
MSLIEYLAGTHVGLESRRVYGKIWYDDKEHMFGKRGKLAKVIYMLNLGTIPDEVAIDVIGMENKKRIGSIEEEFLSKLKPGDIFTLGGRLYMFDHSREMHAYVTSAQGRSPTIPPWYSEQLPLSYELAEAIGAFRGQLASRMAKQKRIRPVKVPGEIPQGASDLLDELPIDANAKTAIYNYLAEQIAFAKEVPTNRHIVVELTNDSTGREYIIFHSIFGRRVNDALSRSFAAQLSEHFEVDMGVMVNDNGFVLIPEEHIHIDDKTIGRVVSDINTIGMGRIIKGKLAGTELMKRRFRHVAARSFMILRNYMGHKMSVRRQQFNSQLVFKAASEINDEFPVIKETYREIMHDMMDLPRAERIILMLREGSISHATISTPIPSPFSHNMITFGTSDAILMKDRHMHLQRLHGLVMKMIRDADAAK